MTTSTPTPQEEAYIWRIGRALRCGNPDCGCAPSPTDRLHCPVHSHPYVPTLSVRYEPGFGFTFTCSSGCPSEKINDALSRRGLPLESALLTATGASELGLHPYELLIPQPTDWLWPNRIPMGELTVVAGYPASGKTAVALDVATRVSLGADTPDQPGTKFVRAPVVIAAPLKNPRASLLPRLRSLGADLSLIYHADLLSPMHLADFPEEADVESLEDVTGDASAGGVPHFFDPFAPPPPPPERPELPREPSLRLVMNRLASLITRGSAALLIVDQIEHLALIHNARVSHVAGMLNSLAARTGAAVIALAHNPAHSLHAAARYMQPRLGMAGTVFTIALVGEDRARFLVPLSPPMHDALPPIPFALNEAPPIAWREPIPQERLLALSASKASRPQRTDMTAYASRFLTGALAHGPKPAAELTKRARDLGISRHHLSRARIACNVTTARFNPAGSPPGSGHWLWSLAQHTTPPSGSALGSWNPEQGRGLPDQESKKPNSTSHHECAPAEGYAEERAEEEAYGC